MLKTKLMQALRDILQFAKENKIEAITSYVVIYVIFKRDSAFKQMLNECGLKDYLKFMKNLEEIVLSQDNKTQSDPIFMDYIGNFLSYPQYSIDLNEFIHFLIDSPQSDLKEFLLLYELDIASFNKLLVGDELKNDDLITNLENYTVNLNELALNGKLDPVIGFHDEVNRILEILNRRTKANPIIIGDSGVGKTAVIYAVTQTLISSNAPKKLKNMSIYELNLNRLIAGTQNRGELELRATELLSEIKQNKNAILFIDDINANLNSEFLGILKSELKNIKCLITTNYTQFRELSKDKNFISKFSRIDINEPDLQTCVKIIKGIKSRYETYHKVKITIETVELACELAKRYESEVKLPQSAIDILDETGSRANLNQKANYKISKDDINETILKAKNLKDIKSSDIQSLKELDINIKQEIFGQDEAVDSLVKSLFRSYAGFKDENRPIGVFLFTGNSGVGKSELSKALATNLGVKLLRYDMSEYMHEFDISKLIGAPAGYVGFEDGGILTNQVKKFPHSVILLDEIEKAHPRLLNLFLQVFDNAKLNDNYADEISFKNTIIIMTSNLGTKEPNSVGFSKIESNKTDSAIKDFFAPEFRNRIDKIINFKNLDHKILNKIIDKSISKLTSKDIKIKLSQEAKDFIIKIGYNNEFGARNIKRVIDENILDILSEQILFSDKKSFFVDFKHGKIIINSNAEKDLEKNES